jgi:hypothetical protein
LEPTQLLETQVFITQQQAVMVAAQRAHKTQLRQMQTQAEAEAQDVIQDRTAAQVS